jgi:hypothetical protein
MKNEKLKMKKRDHFGHWVHLDTVLEIAAQLPLLHEMEERGGVRRRP